LVPEDGEAGPVQVPESTNDNEEIDGDLERSNSRNEEIAIQVVDDNQQHGQAGKSENRNQSSENPSWAPRSWSVRRPKMFGFAKFRSHSTGHSLVQPGENLERFTLRLPAEVRKEVLNRAMSNRTRSSATSLPRERSSRRGYRTGEGEASSRAMSYRRIDLSDRAVKSDRWVFFSRGLLMRSQRVGAETGEGSSLKRTGSKTPVKMPSFKCLEPKANAGDETGLVSNESGQSPV
jgi:E3 ubiquitin-protein ligase ATL6/9/15/31/42/55